MLTFSLDNFPTLTFVTWFQVLLRAQQEFVDYNGIGISVLGEYQSKMHYNHIKHN